MQTDVTRSRFTLFLILAIGACCTVASAEEVCSLTEQARLHTAALEFDADFGTSTAVSARHAAVGIPGDGDTNTGAVQTYRLQGTSWEPDTLLTPPPLNGTVTRFGAAVSLHENMLVVGAPETRVNQKSKAGAVFVYVREAEPTGQWHLVSTLMLDDPHADDEFGSSLAMSSEYLLVGIPGDDGQCTHDCGRGAAHVYRRETADGSAWILDARLAVDDAGDTDRLGWAVALDGTTAAVASPWRVSAELGNVGAVRVFERLDGVWTLASTMTGPASANPPSFGYSVALQGDRMVVGAPALDVGADENVGAAFVYERPGGDPGPWSLQAELTLPTPAAFDGLGGSVALEGGLILVGASGRDAFCAETQAMCSTGTAFAFVHDAQAQPPWQLAATLIHSDAGDPVGPWFGDSFGRAISMHGGHAIIGAPLRDDLPFRTIAHGGAYAFSGLSDCDDNQNLNICEIQAGLATDCNEDLVPDECQADCDGDEIPDVCAALPPGAADCNANGSPDDCEIAAGLAQDVNGNGVPDDCECFALADCDDGLYCTGLESCVGGACVSTGDPCAGSLLSCDEVRDECVECFYDADCDDNLTCNGAEVCVSGHCRAGPNLCQADCQAFETLTLDTGAAANDGFGRNVALDGDVAVVGVPQNDDMGNNAGAVKVYRRVSGEWQEETQLHAFGPEPPAWFGTGVSIDNDVIVVGAWPGGLSGKAYVFRHDGQTWMPEAVLEPEAGSSPTDFFANTVDISGDVIVVSASGDVQNGATIGATYVFRHAGGVWTQEKKIVPADGNGGWNFGRCAVSGNVIVVGASGAGNGAVYVYRHAPGQADSWPQEAKLVSGNLQPGAAFGLNVDVDGNRLIATAPHQPSHGRVSVYDFNGAVWQGRPSLSMNHSIDPHSGFGHKVALANPFAVIGVRTDDDGAGDVGSAMIVRWSGTAWVYEAKLSPSAQQISAGFGDSLAFDGSTILVGVSGMDTDAGVDAGAVLVYENIALSTPGQSIDLCGVRSGACCNRSACSPVWTTAECEATPVCDVWDHLPDTFTGCHGDTNGDGVVNAGDRGTISAAIGRRDPANLCVLDMDGNGFINAADRGFVAAAIGRCDRLPDFQNGSGLNRGLPDGRFEPGQFVGPGTSCEEAACTP